MARGDAKDRSTSSSSGDNASSADADVFVIEEPAVGESLDPRGDQQLDEPDVKPLPRWVRYSYTGVNILTACAAM